MEKKLNFIAILMIVVVIMQILALLPQLRGGGMASSARKPAPIDYQYMGGNPYNTMPQNEEINGYCPAEFSECIR